MIFGRTLTSKASLPTPEKALPGRPAPTFALPARHAVLDATLDEQPPGTVVLYLGMGCFWGAEKKYWQLPGVVTTAAGYAGGSTPHATYDEVCTGRTGHSEVVKVVYDPQRVSTRDVLRVFWENHDPTQGFRQGNDVGTQYRSVLYWTTDEQRVEAEATRDAYAKALKELRLGDITTEIAQAPAFYYAEPYHQQYLAKNPLGYDCHSSTGVKLPA